MILPRSFTTSVVILSSLVSCLPVVLHSQPKVVPPYAIDLHSKNGEYVLHMEGRYLEGYLGGQTIILKTSDKELWTKKVEILSTPIISNLGDVALIGKDEGLFDKSGNKLGVVTVVDSVRVFYAPQPSGTPIHSYSIDGKKYYTFLDNHRDTVTFIATDRNGKELWRVPISKHDPIPTDIMAFSGGVIVHNFSDPFPGALNSCYLINDQGTVLGAYKTSFDGVMPPSLDYAKQVLRLKNPDKVAVPRIMELYRIRVVRTAPLKIDEVKKQLTLFDGKQIDVFDLTSGALRDSIPFEVYLKSLNMN